MDLKPCPFCGATAIEFHADKEDDGATACSITCDCGIWFRMGVFGAGISTQDREKEVETIWNKRI